MFDAFFVQLPFGAAQLVNAVATVFALMGGWLWIATSLREAHGRRALAAGKTPQKPAATKRMNQFFYCFGAACLVGALAISQLSVLV